MMEIGQILQPQGASVSPHPLYCLQTSCHPLIVIGYGGL